MSTAIAKTNGQIRYQNAITKEQGAELFQKLILNNDLSSLSPVELVHYYHEVCSQLGLDPLRKPFEVLTLDGKKMMYPTKECTAQLTAIRGLTVQLVDQPVFFDGMVMYTARCSDSFGRAVEDIGVVSLSRWDKGRGGYVEMTGDSRANAIMKAATKAKRRAVLAFCGLGMIDESERPEHAKEEHVDIAQIANLTDEEDAAVRMWREIFEGVQTVADLNESWHATRGLSEQIRGMLAEFITAAMQRVRARYSKDVGEFVEVKP